MKVERQKQRIELNYDELEHGHLYIDVSDKFDTDVYLATDDGVASLDTGLHYAGIDDNEFPKCGKFVEVGGKVVIND